ncbi:transposase [Roseobacter sp. EG26]|uniref:transposase n=1 Tax=Roseobacter sp. EG26 TaxID=3412477 RepID=UPI003CE4E232
MKRSFSDEQIIGMIKEYEAGVKAQELCHKYGISDAEPPPLKWSAPIFRKVEDERWPLRDPSQKRLS